MGTVLDSYNKEKKLKMERCDPKERTAHFELEDENGFLFVEKYYIPQEILTIILSFLSPQDILFCRLVSRSWCNIIDTDVWRIKMKRINVDNSKLKLHWSVCYLLLSKLDMFDKNLVKNECGQDKLMHWNVRSNGGDRWLVEKPPAGCDGSPTLSTSYDKHQSCFVTSYYSCSKEQIVDLTQYAKLIDELRPQIYISEWFSGRFDCRAVYEIIVELLDEEKTPLDAFETRKNVGGVDGWEWKKVEHTFHDYPPGVRFIKFYHGGVDQQFWKGHYGSKMTDACVIIKLPTSS